MHKHRITNIYDGTAILSPEFSFEQYKDIKLLECVQWRLTKIAKSLKGKT